jgi:Flp pilus assembly protein CpaB
MRGSLLAVVAVAVIAGLGVVAAVRSLGFLTPAVAGPTQPPPPAPTPPPAPPPPPQVVVAKLHMFAGDTVDPENVVVRPLRPEELKDYEANKADYVGSVPAVTYFRYLAKDVVADTPVKKADLEAPKKPDALNVRLPEGTRAVDLPLARELAAGGMIAVGDWVDVYILTDVARTDNPARVPQNGVLVQSAPVVAKRSTLFFPYTSLPAGPIGHTLAVNPYRAALIDYARAVGTISLVPVSQAERARLDALKAAKGNLAIPFAAPGSPEYRDEQDRIEKYARGEVAVGRTDLARILRLPQIVPPPPPAPRAAPVQVELFTGTQRSGTATFPSTDAPPPYVPPPLPEYTFIAPTTPDNRPTPGTTTRPVATPPKN